MEKTILIVIQNVIQYYSLRPLLLRLISRSDWHVDIITFGKEYAKEGFDKIADEVRKTAAIDKISISDTPSRPEYKICLSPYQDMAKVKYKYLLGYCYGAATTKPTSTLRPEFKMKFHGMFLHDIYGADLFSVYAKTYIVPYLYLKNTPTHSTQSKKPVLLYLPTYNEPDTIDVAKALIPLKSKYYIITKGHHGTQHLTNEQSKQEILREIPDEYYGSDQYIQPLLDRADVVLSDNSGAVMDALYVGVPVCIACKDINRKIADIDTLQYTLVEDGIIPYTKNIASSSIEKVIESALKNNTRKKQLEASDQLFPLKHGGVTKWIGILEDYMNDTVSQNYCKLHDYYTSTNEKNLVENIALKSQIEKIKKELLEKDRQLDFYRSSRIHKTAEYIRSFFAHK